MAPSLTAAKLAVCMALFSGASAITMNQPRCSEQAPHIIHPLDQTMMNTQCSNGPCWSPTSNGRAVCWYVCPASTDPAVPTMFEGRRVRPGFQCNRAPPMRDDMMEGMVAPGGILPFVDSGSTLGGTIGDATAASMTAPGTGDIVQLSGAGGAPASDESEARASWTFPGTRYDIDRANFFVHTASANSGGGVDYVDGSGLPMFSFQFTANATVCTGFSMVINGRCINMVDGNAVAINQWYSVEFDVNWVNKTIDNVIVARWTSVSDSDEEMIGSLPLAHSSANGIAKINLWQETYPTDGVAWKSFGIFHDAVIPFAETLNKYKPMHQWVYAEDAYWPTYRKE